MPSILIQLDDATLPSLDKIRQAVKEAIRKREYEQIREAYLRRPDSATEADDWSSAEDWKP